MIARPAIARPLVIGLLAAGLLCACGGTTPAVRPPAADAGDACGPPALLKAVVLLVNGLAGTGGADEAASAEAIELLSSDACRADGAHALAFLAEVHMARRMIWADRADEALAHLERAAARAEAAGYGRAVQAALKRLTSEAYEAAGDIYRAADAIDDDPWIDRLIERADRR